MADRMHQDVHAAFDWAAAHNRLQEAIRKTEAVDRLDPADTKRILDARARAIARPAAVDTHADDLTVVSFSLGLENYALEASYIREIARIDGLLLLPGTPGFVVGALKLRGGIHAVFDINALTAAVPVSPIPTSRVIVVGYDRIEFGLIADVVHGVTNLAESAVHPIDERTDGKRAGFIQGYTTEATLLIDGAALLNDPSLYIGKSLDLGVEDSHGART